MPWWVVLLIFIGVAIGVGVLVLAVMSILFASRWSRS